MAVFNVATDRTWTDKAGARQKEAEFHSIVSWGRQAEIANQFLKKGGLVLVEGRLQTRSWQDKQGQPRKTTEIICERLQLGPKAFGAPMGGPTTGGPGPAGMSTPKDDAFDLPTPDASMEEIPIISLDDDEIKSDDLPF